MSELLETEVMGSIQESKAELRRTVRAKLRALTEPQKAAGAEQARARLNSQKAWQEARAILFYAPLPDELDVWPLVSETLQTGKEVYLPRFDAKSNRYLAHGVRNPESDLEAGQFGIREPAGHCPQLPLNRLDFVLVPGIAFDLRGRRLGRGRAYYDQILAAVRGKTCGVGFDEQIVSEIPVEPHDIVVHCILTPSRWVEP